MTKSALSDALRAQANGQAANRLLTLIFPGGDWGGPPLIAHHLEATEGVSLDFVYRVGVFGAGRIELKTIMARSVTVALQCEDKSFRYFNGIVDEFSFDKFEAGVFFYGMVLRPAFHLLGERENCHVFNGKTVRQQTGEVFADYPDLAWELRLSGPDEPLFSNQINETDHNHLCRLWQARGLGYYYEQDRKGHKIIITDRLDDALPIAAPSPNVSFQRRSVHGDEDIIHTWRAVRRLVPGRFVDAHYDFKAAKGKQNAMPSTQRQGGASGPERRHFDGTHNDNDGPAAARLAAKTGASDGAGKFFEADSNIRYMAPGRWFGFANGFTPTSELGDDYLIVEVVHEASNNDLVSTGKEGNYRNSVRAVRRGVDWLPPAFANCTDHRIAGVQTATVVGPAGEEIFTNEHGQVKICYHWDMERRHSTWVRVASGFASQNFGFVAIPRVGDEVIIVFLDGNPDRPLIIGSLFNACNTPSWPLPQSKTQSGILTRSTPKGNRDTANVLRFDDQKGEEEVWLRAEKNQRIEVENDESHWVGRDRRVDIDHDETTIIRHNRDETVDNDENITVGHCRTERVGADEDIGIGGNRTENVGKNEDIGIKGSRSVHVGHNKSETVAGSKTETARIAKTLTVGGLYQISVGGAMNATVGLSISEQVGISKSVVAGQKISNTAGEEYCTEVGESKFVMHKSGRVEIHCTELFIYASKKVEIHGDDVDTNPAS